MHVRHVSLTNFRLYARLELDLPGGLTLIQGDNAQGKTSLLEALHFLATAHSMHTASDRQVIRWGAAEESPYPFMMLKAELERADGAHTLELAMQTTEGSRLRKEIRIDHVTKRNIDLVGQLAVVLFLPNDVELPPGAPSLRRQFLDDALSQVDIDYVRHLDRYGKALTQRNALLRAAQERRVDPDEFAVWEGPLVESGVAIASKRHATVGALAALAAPIHRELSAGREYLDLRYLPNFDPHAPPSDEPYQVGLNLSIPSLQMDEPTLREAFQSALRTRLKEEIARGATLTGPHRDDLRFTANGMDIGEFGSRGQQRTTVLSLKLAQAQWMRGLLHDEPVLLLDEVLAELDPQRRRQLLGHISGSSQTLVTTTDVGRFEAEFVEKANVLNVRGGIVQAT